MCGHVGAITRSKNGFSAKESDAILALLYFDNFRGEDATSLTMIDNQGLAVVLKEATSAPDFIREKEVQTLTTQAISRGKAFMGHNRKATVGGYKDEQAHPFIIDDRWIFNHNGKLQNHVKYFQTEVDSEAFGKLLCPKLDDITELGKTLSEVDAAYTIAAYDAKEHVIHLMRNVERPLWFARSAVTLWYASEAWMLRAVSDLYDLKLGDPVSAPIHKLYTFDLKAEDPTEGTVQEVTVVKKSTPPTKGATQAAKSCKQAVSPGTKEVNGARMGFANGYLQTIFEQDDLYPQLSKSKYRKDAKKLAGDVVVCWIDDVMPVVKDPSDTRTKFVAYASCEDYPNWVFMYYFYSNSYEEAQKYAEGRLITGRVTGFQYDAGWGCASYVPSAKISVPSRVIKANNGPSQLTH